MELEAVFNWENGKTKPAVESIPAIIEFLGYDPFPDSTRLSERLAAVRRANGWTIKEAAVPAFLCDRYGEVSLSARVDRNKNVAAVALANKNARIAWALLRHDREYALYYTSVLATK